MPLPSDHDPYRDHPDTLRDTLMVRTLDGIGRAVEAMASATAGIAKAVEGMTNAVAVLATNLALAERVKALEVSDAAQAVSMERHRREHWALYTSAAAGALALIVYLLKRSLFP